MKYGDLTLRLRVRVRRGRTRWLLRDALRTRYRGSLMAAATAPKRRRGGLV